MIELIHILYMVRQSSVIVVERWSVGDKQRSVESGSPPTLPPTAGLQLAHQFMPIVQVDLMVHATTLD